MDGFLILDKPVGITSAKAVAEVKRLLGAKKIGHGGTLDPLASGILPLAIGEATKAFDYVAGSIKEYRFTVTFGEERATDDSEGAVTGITDVLPSQEDIRRALPEFTGKILQTPPVYSALKVNGERAYKRARAGEAIKMTPREVEIHALRLEIPSPVGGGLGWGRGGAPADADTFPSHTAPPPYRGRGGVGIASATFTVTCGKGTYVRALARDIARTCNSLGYISMLRRTRVGKFIEARAISLDKLPSLMHNAALFEAWVPIELALDDIPAIELESRQADALRHGRPIGMVKPDGRYVALHQGRIVALADCMSGMLTSCRVFNLNQ